MNPNEQVVTGTLELGQNNSGFLRDPTRNYAISPNDPQVTRDVVQKFRLRGGESITAQVNRGRQGRGQPQISRIETIGGMSVMDYAKVTPFDEPAVLHPPSTTPLYTSPGPTSNPN